MKQERVLILIDGSNFFFKLKDLRLHNLLKLNFVKFGAFLAKSGKIVESRYYVGRVRQDGTEKSKQLFDGQQKLIGLLKNSNYRYCLGYLLKSNGIYREKGVDVQIAIDVIIATYENTCDRIILVSSDTDLLPAIKKAQQKGKIVEYVGFSHMPSVAMVSRCKESRLITKDEIESFIEK